MTVYPQGTRSLIDGKPRGAVDGRSVPLEPGQHTFTGVYPDYENAQETRTFKAGDVSAVHLQLYRKPAAPAQVTPPRAAPANPPSKVEQTPVRAEPAAPGAPGNNGADACSAAVSKGGAETESGCLFNTSKGGKGGDSSATTAESGANGEPAADPPSGLGGVGEQNAPSCTNGQNGADGAEGAYGLGGNGKPRIGPDGYHGRYGYDGQPGARGQGGGGGGATFGNAAACGASPSGGAAGGSGGSGGCGGKGGAGGQAGGASIGILTRSVFRGTHLFMEAKRGGNGGNGGPPQLGGVGGAPGNGGKGAGSIKPACAGGAGGNGGKGGRGGGGQGGAAVPYAFPEAFKPILKNNAIKDGIGGIGGEGESVNASGSYGQDGITDQPPGQHTHFRVSPQEIRSQEERATARGPHVTSGHIS